MRATAFPGGGVTVEEAQAEGVGGVGARAGDGPAWGAMAASVMRMEHTLGLVLLELKMLRLGKAGSVSVQGEAPLQPPVKPSEPIRPAPPMTPQRTVVPVVKESLTTRPGGAGREDSPEPTKAINGVDVINDAPSDPALLPGWISKLTPTQLDRSWVAVVMDLLYTARHTGVLELPSAQTMLAVLNAVKDRYAGSPMRQGAASSEPLGATIELKTGTSFVAPVHERATTSRAGDRDWARVLAMIPKVGDEVKLRDLFPFDKFAVKRAKQRAEQQPREFAIFRREAGTSGPPPIFVQRIALPAAPGTGGNESGAAT